MKLYYSPGACSLASHIALLEGGLDFELERVDLHSKLTETGVDFNTINTKGYVPAPTSAAVGAAGVARPARRTVAPSQTCSRLTADL